METSPERNGLQADSLDRLTRLQALTAALSEAVTSEQVAEAILAQAATVLGTNTGVVARLSDDGGEFICLHARGYPQEIVKDFERFPADARLPLADAVRERKPVLLAGLAERDALYPDLARRTGIRDEGALVSLPLVVRGKAIGGIGLRFPSARAFTEQDRAFLLTVAGLCAQALERAGLYDKERAAREQAERAENALRASEARLRSIIDNWPSVIFVKDLEGRYLLANSACEAYAGEPVERIIGKTDHDYMPAEVADRFRADDLFVIGTGQALRYEEVAPRGGEERVSLTVKFLLRDAGGQPYGVCGIATDVTDWKRAGESLRVSEERFARFMQHLPGLAWIKDAQGKYVYANEAALVAFGKPRAELYGRTDAEVFPPETAAQFRANDEKALAAGTGARLVETLEHPDGTLHHSLVSKFPIPGPDGAAALVGGMAIDITEEKRTRAILEESEERFRGTFEQAAVGISHVGLDGRWLRVNQKLCDIVGYDCDELLALTFQDITHPDDLQADLDQLRRLLAGAIGTYSMEKRYIRKDGTVVWINLTVALVRTPRGQPKYLISVVQDITEQKEVRDALRESETRYRNLFHNMAEEVHFWQLVRDEQGQIRTWRLVDANPPALRTWGRTLDQVRGKTTDEIFGPGSTDHYRAVVQKIMAEGVPHAFEDYFPNLDKHFRFTSVPLGEFFITTGADITSVKKAHVALRESESRLRDQAEQLRQADRRKDHFVMMLAHELRNPLAPLRNSVQVLRAAGGDGELVEQALRIMERQVGHMSRMIEELLDVSRLMRGRVHLHAQRLDLGQLVRTALDDQRPALERAGLSLDARLPELPVWVNADPTRLTQVFDNLVQNAVKFTDPGGRVLVRVEADQSRRRAVLTINDTGIGIEPGLLPHLFETFTQADRSLDRSKGGLGLGLSLVKGMVELHGGSVEARSEGAGRGAEFVVALPLQPEPAAVTALPSSPERAPQRLRVLVVEDNRDAADTLKLLLELIGYEVAVAYTGPTGVEAAKQWGPDVILCDIGLPGLDGYGVARELRQNPATAKTRLVAVTGYGSDEDRRRSREAGFDAHLTKPADPVQLREILTSSESVN